MAPTFENGDSLKQLLARSRYLLFKKESLWTASQKQRAEILFREYPAIPKAYYLSMQLGLIYHQSKSKEVVTYLNDLVEILYEKDYFGFKESAYDYVDWIFEQIDTSIERKVKKTAPKHFEKYGLGLSYISYKRINNTVWYVFFRKQEETCLIFYISNNHNCAQFL